MHARTLRAFAAMAVVAVSLSAHAERLVGRVVGVADGDTITVLDAGRQQHRIRLAGIDAPEKAQAYGQRSKQSLSDLVFGNSVVVNWDKHDQYGRIIGQVNTPSGQDANRLQIERGMAWHYKQFAKERPADESAAYNAAEQRARQQHAGLWADKEPTPPWAWRREQKR